MNDLVSEYQQYQDATAEEEGEFDEEEGHRFRKGLGITCVMAPSLLAPLSSLVGGPRIFQKSLKMVPDDSRID